jgi:hypothetical protein
MTVMIRVPLQTHEQLRRLAAARNEPIGKVVAAAVERLDEEHFWAEVHAAYDRLRAEPAAWEQYQAEIREWDVAMLDGLEDEPSYYAPGEDE